ncbi:MAG: acyl-CoA reductase [Capsulimonadaceae bacterium]
MDESDLWGRVDTDGPVSADCIVATASRLRAAHRQVLSGADAATVVGALDALASSWRGDDSQWRQRASALDGTFGWEAARGSLDVLLDGLHAAALRELLETERVERRTGFTVVGHVIAGNSPLLGWVSMIRALLVRSASLVKLPSGPEAEGCYQWARLFVDSLASIDPRLARTIALMRWAGADRSLSSELCRASDIVLAYGADATLAEIGRLCNGRPFVGYGHRLSCVVLGAAVDHGVSEEDRMHGVARDVLLYDQEGCLSPQAVLVLGDQDRAARYAGLLSRALAEETGVLPAPIRSEAAAAVVSRVRSLGRMEDAGWVTAAEDQRWTVLTRRTVSGFPASPGYGIVTVAAVPDHAALSDVLQSVRGVLQGVAIAADGQEWDLIERIVRDLGATYCCRPGELQRPPLSWRQDGVPLLRSLLQ